MAKVISTKKPIELLNRLWVSSTPSQRKALLKARGLSTTWSKAKTIKEMVDRGGGMVANSLLQLVRIHNRRNPNIKRVIFKK